MGHPLDYQNGCLIIFFTSLRERDKREKSEEKIDCHHQDSNQGPSLVASDALTTELWCSRHPSRDCSTFSSDFVTHTSCVCFFFFSFFSVYSFYQAWAIPWTIKTVYYLPVKKKDYYEKSHHYTCVVVKKNKKIKKTRNSSPVQADVHRTQSSTGSTRASKRRAKQAAAHMEPSSTVSRTGVTSADRNPTAPGPGKRWLGKGRVF